MEVLIFYADTLIVMANSKNVCIFNFAILLKTRKFDAFKMYVFYSNYQVTEQMYSMNYNKHYITSISIRQCSVHNERIKLC